MDLKNVVNNQLIFLDFPVSSQKEAIHWLGQQLMDKGYIDTVYIQAMEKREQEFPTGLQLSQIGVAIPHATPEGHVLHNGIAALRVKNPITFHSMEDVDDTVHVSLVVMLALKDANDHIDMLQNLFTMFQNQETVDKLLHVETAQDFQQIMIQSLA